METIVRRSFKNYEDHVATVDFLAMILTFLGYKSTGNGIESGFRKGQYEYWFFDDGDIALEKHDV